MLTWVVQAERGRQGLVPCLPRADVDRRHGLRDQGQAASPGRASSRAGWAGSSHALCSGDERGRRPGTRHRVWVLPPRRRPRPPSSHSLHLPGGRRVQHLNREKPAGLDPAPFLV